MTVSIYLSSSFTANLDDWMRCLLPRQSQKYSNFDSKWPLSLCLHLHHRTKITPISRHLILKSQRRKSVRVWFWNCLLVGMKSREQRRIQKKRTTRVVQVAGSDETRWMESAWWVQYLRAVIKSRVEEGRGRERTVTVALDTGSVREGWGLRVDADACGWRLVKRTRRWRRESG